MNPIRALLRRLAGWFAPAPPAPTGAVGFHELSLPQPDGPPLPIGVWHPSHDPVRLRPFGLHRARVAVNGAIAGDRLPLVVMSHGAGGWHGAQYTTALALADAGFVVAAVTHPGDTFQDRSRSFAVIDRPYHIRRALDHMLSEWPGRARLDPSRIGMIGYSVGGFTTLVIAGGVPRPERLARHCAEHPEEPICRLAREQGADVAALNSGPGRSWQHDPRVKAAVIAAPALGMLFGPEGLAGVRLPLQIWAGGLDRSTPEATNAAQLRRDLPTPPEYHLVPDAGHVSFLAPCARSVARRHPHVCGDARGFDRRVFNMRFNAEIVRFLSANLPAAAP